MSLLLLDKVIAITGSSSGIGRAIALECARHGAKLVLHYIGDEVSREDIKTLKQELEALGREKSEGQRVVDIALDVRDEDAGKRIVEAAVRAFGELNGMVHNAGICQFADFEAVTSEQQQRHMEINFAAPFCISQTVAQQMQRQPTGGSIVSIASVSATMGSSQLVHYSATKAALLGMTASCAVALGKHGIRFNAVSPGTIETTLNQNDLKGGKKEVMEKKVPLGRLGRPEDVARVVVFFLSDLAGYVSGQNLVVDGAATVNYQ